ncbi:MAG: DUF2442 domain-containing protein [Campylobacterales bacterium]|nr:DUF2442 domain-containing protein [Campylobacterales bacterium]
MHYLVKHAHYLGDYKLHIEFNDGHSGTVDLSSYPKRGGVFAPLHDLALFKQFQLNGWTIVWDDEIDIAPERLYELAISKEHQ